MGPQGHTQAVCSAAFDSGLRHSSTCCYSEASYAFLGTADSTAHTISCTKANHDGSVCTCNCPEAISSNPFVTSSSTTTDSSTYTSYPHCPTPNPGTQAHPDSSNPYSYAQPAD